MEHVPWPAVKMLLFAPPIVPVVGPVQPDVMFDLSVSGMRTRKLIRNEAHLRKRILKYRMRTRGVHVAPPRDRCLVFDLDLRDQEDRACIDAHDRRLVCRICWEYARTAVANLETLVRQPLGISAPPLVVYSGANGLHVWYALASAPPEVALVIADAAARERLIERVQTHSRVVFDFKPTRIPDLSPVTGQPLKFSHTIRLPLSRHTVTGRLAMPLDPSVLPFPLDAEGRSDERREIIEAATARFTAFIEAAIARVPLDS